MPDEETWEMILEDGGKVERRPRGVSFQVLGTRVTLNNRFTAEIASRTQKAWRTYSAVRELLDHPAVPAKAKV